jgi:hypothetical protein
MLWATDNAFQMIHIRNKIWIFVASSLHEKKILLEALENGIRKSASNKDVQYLSYPCFFSWCPSVCLFTFVIVLDEYFRDNSSSKANLEVP